MSNTGNINRTERIAFILIASFLFLSSLCYADVLSSVLRKWDPAALKGNIMEVGPDLRYLIVNEIKVVLVDTNRRKRVYKTRIMDIDGNILKANVLSKGKEIFIRGAVVMDKRTNDQVLVAKDIYVLKGSSKAIRLKIKKILAVPASRF